MATVEELRADFTATFGNMTAGIRTIRQALQGIGQESQDATRKANTAFQSFNATLTKLQTELKKTGNQSGFKDLNDAAEKAQKELKETGAVSEQSMKQLQESVMKAKQKLGALTDDSKKNLREFEPLLNSVDAQLKQLGLKTGLSKMTDEERLATLQTMKYSDVIDTQNKKLDEENKRYKDLSSGVLGAGSKTDQYRAKAEHLNNVLGIQSETVQVLQRKYNDSVSSVGKNAEETQNLASAIARAQGSMKSTEDALSHVNTKIDAQSTMWGRLNNKLDDVKMKYEHIEHAGMDVSMTFGIATLAAAAGVGKVTKSAADFEQEMSNVKSVMDPADVHKYSDSLERLAIVQGAKTKYSALEAAEAEGELVKAGLSVSDIMHGALSGALNLATAGELNLKDAAEIAATALNAFRKDNLSVAQAANILAGAANASASDVGELKIGLSQVSAVASGVGWSFKDTVTALAEFSQYGLKGSDAGTSLKTMLQNLQPQTKAQVAQFRELGIVTKDGSNQFIDAHGHFKGLADIADILHESIKNLTDAQRSQALETMFGSDAIRAGNILYRAGAEGIDQMATSMDKIKAADVAKQKLDNFNGTVEQLRGSANTAAITLGEALLPALKFITEAIQKAVDWFNCLPEPIQHVIAVSGATAVALMALVSVFGLVALGIGSAFRGMQSFIVLMSKFRSGASASSAAAKTLGASAAAAGAAMDTAGGSVGKTSGKVKALHGVLGLASAGLMLFGGKWGVVSGIVMNLLPEIINVGKGILSFARVALTGGAAAEGLAGGLGGTATILEILGGPIGWTILAITTLATAFYLAYKNIKPFHDWVDRTTSSLKNGFVGAVNKVKDFFQPMIKTTIDWGKSVDKATQTALNGYVKLSDQAQKKLEELVITGKIVGKQDVAGLVKPYKDMADQIIGHFERMDKQSENALSALRKANKKEYDQIKKDAEAGTKQKETAVQKIENQIEDIYKDAAKNHRSITADEQDKINKLQSKMNTYAAESMSKSAKQQEIILGKLKDHASSLTADQAAAVVRNSKKQRDKTVDNAKDQYEKVKKHANSQYNSAKKWADQQYYALHNISKKQHDAVVKAAADQRDKTISSAKKQKDKTIGHAKDMHEKVVDQAKKQAHGHRDQVDWETGKVLSKWNKFTGSFAHVMNGVSGFFNKMFSKIGLKSLKIPTWKPAGYAKGTKGTQKDEIALTGEQGFELAHTPGHGVYAVGQKGPEMRFLPKGTSILPHKKSVDLLSALGIKGYASGVGDFFSGLWDKIKSGVSWASDMVFSAPKKLVSWISDKVGLGDFQKRLSDWPAIHGLSVQLPKNMFKGITDKLKDFGSSADPPGSGVERWRTSVIRALAMNGLSTSGSMVNKVLRQMQTESGGNPKAVQHGYTDINTIKGDLAKGLMQTISATFNAYKFPGHGNIFNGFDNLLAALNYAKHRYGSSLSALGKGHGYANGGWNFMHTLAEISEGNKAEVILPVENKNRTLDLMAQVLSTYGINLGSQKQVAQAAGNQEVNVYVTGDNYFEYETDEDQFSKNIAQKAAAQLYREGKRS
ncbi:phage tail tape measure protein [Sporolactobacillus terrae]|uniref:phage tail tape measure protein n=1 Tax=Sporolactobacillus terrae TaxID=269673 RepID=UPI001CBD8B0D|nr:phage tail tape measure protein [Sporolactobacillus terrae]UAK17552.1 phage tail tape measure protein [Sporolactobacillus terrae]